MNSQIFDVFSDEDENEGELDGRLKRQHKRNAEIGNTQNTRTKNSKFMGNSLGNDSPGNSTGNSTTSKTSKTQIVFKSDAYETSVEKLYSASSTTLLEKSSKIETKNEFENKNSTSDGMDVEDAKEHAVMQEGVDESIVVAHKIRHQVALPQNYKNFIPIAQHIPSTNPARNYAFTLDSFQRTAINAIERNESVLVSAHTSAGKTVVAEYAIATALRNKQRVIYTSPIKALSNQKYRDLLTEFGDVGLMTGDVTINEDATCLVMTTEILRSMLYRGSEITREMSWVIFDEIHYMRDAVRGVVWEETLIMLPDVVHFVFLSATIPNAMQFAEWICQIKNQPCHVVYTDYRPTPLQHYLFPNGGDGIHLVVDEKSNFREDNFQKAISNLTDSNTAALDTKSKKKWGNKPQKGSSNDLFKIIKMINSKNYHPVIVFSFSKKECENNALQLSKLDFNSEEDKEIVGSIYENAIQSLNEDDRTLPQIEHILPLLQRGIGIHHSGLLPILKEVIEILFQEGLLKVLFATETFSIGLNMPAKTVVFTSVRKFDGKDMRWLSGGEYIQMSGRAGRRGLDDRGIVILMIDEKMEPDIAKGMLKGVSDSLDSAFHLTYTMILNLSRVDGVPPEYMLQKSFHQYQNTAKIPSLSGDVEIYQKRLDGLVIDREEAVAEYYQITTQLKLYYQDVRDVVTAPSYILPFLQPGRLIQISKPSSGLATLDFGWGVVVNLKQALPRRGDGEGPIHIVDVLIHVASSDFNDNPLPCPDGEIGEMIIAPCALSSVDALSTIRVNTPKELRTKESRHHMLKTVREVCRRFPTGVPKLDPIKDMGIKDESFIQLSNKIIALEKSKKEHDLDSDTQLPDLYQLYETKVELQSKIKSLQKEMTQAESILQMDELKCRRRVLRRLGYTSETDIIDVKGRVACEISAGDELVLTEMIFNGVFNDLSIEQTAALLSCFAFSEKSRSVETEMKPELLGPLRILRETATRVAEVSVECKVELDPKEYVETFRHELMPVVFAWALGAKFSQICKLTDVFEGSIIRSMRRLEELLRQLVVASNTIGNTELEEKFEACIVAIKRDIVFANSLYL